MKFIDIQAKFLDLEIHHPHITRIAQNSRPQKDCTKLWKLKETEAVCIHNLEMKTFKDLETQLCQGCWKQGGNYKIHVLCPPPHF